MQVRIAAAFSVTVIGGLCAGAPFLAAADFGVGPAVWHVAWSGAAAVGAYLDIPAALAQCLCLPAGIAVTVSLLGLVSNKLAGSLAQFLALWTQLSIAAGRSIDGFDMVRLCMNKSAFRS